MGGTAGARKGGDKTNLAKRKRKLGWVKQNEKTKKKKKRLKRLKKHLGRLKKTHTGHDTCLSPDGGRKVWEKGKLPCSKDTNGGKKGVGGGGGGGGVRGG